MLRARVLTALVLLAVLLPAIFVFPPVVWGALTLGFLAVAAWEWGRLLPGASNGRALGASATVLVLGALALAWRANGAWPTGSLAAVCAVLSLFWAIAGPRRLRHHDASGGGVWLAGALLLGCWLALFELRLLGALPLLSSMAVIWVADIAAYFAGRRFGRRKLAPAISPGKSWEGALGGFVAVAFCGLAVASVPALQGALPGVLVDSVGMLATVPLLLGIAALSIVGDLHESLLKRSAGVKDSGSILPGHGGVLDRIDALIPTLAAALLIYLLLR